MDGLVSLRTGCRIRPIKLAVALLTLFCVALFFTSHTHADDSGYSFVFSAPGVRPGDDVTITVQGSHEQSAQGFVFAARYPTELLTVHEIHPVGTILEAIEVEAFDVEHSSEEGYIIVTVLVDISPPFDGELIPNVTFPLDFFHIEATVSADAESDVLLVLENGMSFPPKSNLYTVENQTIPVNELNTGLVPVIAGPLFIRADSNMSHVVNIADPMYTLGAIFLGSESIGCLQAADANDDDRVNVADPVFTFDFIFNGGSTPPMPYGVAGPDPTPGALTCESEI